MPIHPPPPTQRPLTPLTPPAGCAPLADILARFGGAPELAVASDGAGPFACLPGGRVYGSGLVLSPNGTTLASETAHDFGSPPGQHWLQTYTHLRPPRPLAGTTAVLAVNLGSRYAHWLWEELPRWLALHDGVADQILVHQGAPFIAEAQQLRPLKASILPVRRHGHYACEHLLIPTGFTPAGSPHAPGPRELALVTTLVAPWLDRSTTHTSGPANSHAPGTTPAARLYLTREHCTRRRVTNEAALSALLLARGFRILALEQLPWRAQIEAFATAREIVAPHGGGLANLIFCQPGTRVYELFHPAYVNPCYAHLARRQGLDYTPVVTTATACSYEPRAGRLDIAADLDHLRRALGK